MARPLDKRRRLFQVVGVFGLMGALLLPGTPADAMGATTERVSVSSRGAEGDGTSHSAAISADGRFIAFHSAPRTSSGTMRTARTTSSSAT
jgi:hypothetical protein